MRMTPLEIQGHRFGRRLNGFDRDEVETFLRMVTEDYEEVLKENALKNDQIHRLEEQLDRLTKQEQLLKQTLMNAQTLTDRMRESADKECDVLLGEAEIHAEKIIDASHRRAARLAENIREMHGVRAGLAAALKSVIETHLGLIDGLTSDDENGDSLVEGLVDGKITYLAAGSRKRDAEKPRSESAESAESSGSA